MFQQTIKSSIECRGIAMHSGKEVLMRIKPAPSDSGILFIRTDLENNNVINVSPSSSIESKLCTVLINSSGAKVSTIEHLMSALWGCGIDNAIIELNNEEMPIMDGSSIIFVEMINKAGIKKQTSPRKILEIKQVVRVEDGDKFIELRPGKDFSIAFDIEFSHQAIGKQCFTFHEDSSYHAQIGRARTYGFLKELEAMQSMGLARGASLENAIGIDDHGVMNPEGLRYSDEFVRHKILDCIGDLYVLGLRIRGHVIASKTSHAIHSLLLKKLLATPSAYEIAPTINENSFQTPFCSLNLAAA
jgi:UDP-3-O-[3-hydroxymyristoyl] N-acetylglucosamine deacetylase